MDKEEIKNDISVKSRLDTTKKTHSLYRIF